MGQDPAQLAQVELGPLVAQQGQADPLAPHVAQLDVHRVQPLVEERRREERFAARGDHLRAAPEADRLVHADAVAEDGEARRQLGVGPHQRPPRHGRAQADLVDRRKVAARRGRDVDQQLRAVEGQRLGHAEVPEVLADGDAELHAQARVDGPEPIARGEEAALVEEAVGGQEQLAVDEPNLAVLQQRGRDEEPVIVRLLDERDDGRQRLRPGGEAEQARVVLAHRDFGRQVLELVAGQAELRKHDQPRTGGACLRQKLAMAGQVLLEHAEARRELNESDSERLHQLSLAPVARSRRLVRRAPWARARRRGSRTCGSDAACPRAPARDLNLLG